MEEKDLTFAEFREKMEARARFYRDEEIQAGALRMDPTNGELIHAKQKEGTEEVATTQYELLPWGFSTMCAKLNVPAQYMKRCPFSLRAENINYWLEVFKDKDLFVRFDSAPDGVTEKVRAVLSKKYADFPNTLLAKLLDENMDPKYNFRVSFDDNGARLAGEIVSHSDQYSNDEHAGAIQMVNSEIGLHKLVLRAMVYCKALKSGVILKQMTGFSEKHIGNKKIFAKDFKDAMDGLMQHYSGAIRTLEDLKIIQIENPEDILDIICDSNRLKIAHKMAVQRVATVRPPRTLYDIVMAFTAASTDPDITSEERETLQIVGGNVMMNAKRYKRWQVTPEEQVILDLERKAV